MAAVQASTKTFTIVPILHLVFTVVSIAVLSYKVYYVESELSYIRDELSTHDRGNGLDKTLAHSTADAAISENSRDKRSDRNRRLSQKTQEATSKKQIINADCLQKTLKHFQVCASHLLRAVHGAKLMRIFPDVQMVLIACIWQLEFIC